VRNVDGEHDRVRGAQLIDEGVGIVDHGPLLGRAILGSRVERLEALSRQMRRRIGREVASDHVSAGMASPPLGHEALRQLRRRALGAIQARSYI
jgi:hypothetical protein